MLCNRLLLAMLLCSCLVSSVLAPKNAFAAQKKLPAKTIHLVVDYGDGVQKHFTRLAWRSNMTVLDATMVASKHPRGIKIEYRGKGTTAFLTKIDDLENEGRKRNWIYRVNGKLANKSFGAYPLKPGDTILWKFGEYR